MKVRKLTPAEEKREREANLFAMCLLMPEKLVRQEVIHIGGFDLVRRAVINWQKHLQCRRL